MDICCMSTNQKPERSTRDTCHLRLSQTSKVLKKNHYEASKAPRLSCAGGRVKVKEFNSSLCNGSKGLLNIPCGYRAFAISLFINNLCSSYLGTQPPASYYAATMAWIYRTGVAALIAFLLEYAHAALYTSPQQIPLGTNYDFIIIGGEFRESVLRY